MQTRARSHETKPVSIDTAAHSVMTLVAYSDSENSDSDTTLPPQRISVPKTLTPVSRNPPKPLPFQPLVDRGNPRKIHVDFSNANQRDIDDTVNGGSEGIGADYGGPIRKRPRIGGSGAFSGFNALLPAPKRTSLIKRGNDKEDTVPTPSRKVFTLKTSAAPGFDREADAEMIQHQTTYTSEESPVAGSADDAPVPFESQGEEITVKKKGNAMMFKPLSVARNKTKKQLKTVSHQPELDAPVNAAPNTKAAVVGPPIPVPVPELKPKVSLFGLSHEEKPAKPHEPAADYKLLVHNAANSCTVSAGPQPLTALVEDKPQLASPPPSDTASSGPEHQTLTSIANDLNLSRSEMRQLFGRQSAHSSSDQSRVGPKVLTFNTDQEYRSNADYLSSTTEAERVAQQHNPVRSVAPGKHSLQQLVNAVTSQRDALEESFAIGRRNKKEAGSRYGW